MAETAKRPIKRAGHQVGTPAQEEAMTVEVQEDSGQPNVMDMLSLLQEIVSDKAKNPDATLTVPNRERMSLVFSPNFEFDLYQSWIRKATNRKTEEVNWMQLASTVISHTNKAILLDGVRTTYTVTSPELHASLGVAVGGVRQAIKDVYGSEGHAIQAAKIIIDKAGYTIEGDVKEDDEGPLDD